MRRTPVICLLLCLLPAAPAAAQERPPLRATLAACESGPEAVQRFAVFTGSMPAHRGTVRMAMRFVLLERRSATDAWRRVSAPKWGRWNRSKPRRAGFIYTKRIERLQPATTYRAIVRFRWYDADGDVQSSAVRRTPLCEQPDQRPNLVVESLEAAGGATIGSEGRYRLTVVNNGRTPAAASVAGLAVENRGEATRDIARLAPGERVTVEVSAPACRPPDSVTVQLDARGQVDEADEQDNRLTVACPVA